MQLINVGNFILHVFVLQKLLTQSAGRCERFREYPGVMEEQCEYLIFALPREQSKEMQLVL